MYCKFLIAWKGICNSPTNGGRYCDIHKDLKCVSCGKPATHECGEFGQSICREPLCDECQHTIREDGTNGLSTFNNIDLPDGMKNHIKKIAQIYKPWYIQKFEREYGCEINLKTLHCKFPDGKEIHIDDLKK